jgi:hypothetical protein
MKIPYTIQPLVYIYTHNDTNKVQSFTPETVDGYKDTELQNYSLHSMAQVHRILHKALFGLPSLVISTICPLNCTVKHDPKNRSPK